MIIAVGSEKGSPGATTVAAALAAAWPAPCLLLEVDPRGADLPLRLTRPDGTALMEAPSLVGLALAARDTAARPALDRYAQPTSMGVPVVPGEMSVRANARIAPQLPALAVAARDWPGTVVVDVGLLHSVNPALVMARAAACVLYVVRPTLEGFAHLRDNIGELAASVADPRRVRPAVGVVVVAAPREERAALNGARQLLEQLSAPALLAGAIAWDPPGAEMLWTAPTKKSGRTPLTRSAATLAVKVAEMWPELTVPAASPGAALAAADDAATVGEVPA